MKILTENISKSIIAILSEEMNFIFDFGVFSYHRKYIGKRLELEAKLIAQGEKFPNDPQTAMHKLSIDIVNAHLDDIIAEDLAKKKKELKKKKTTKKIAVGGAV